MNRSNAGPWRGRRGQPLLLGLLLFVFLLSVSGCAGSGERSGERTNPNALTADEIAAASGGNLYDVVEELRPRWFQIRTVASLQQQTPEVGVFVNRVYQGGTTVLRDMSKTGVTRMEYMDGPQASARLRTPGATALAGAILVQTGGN